MPKFLLLAFVVITFLLITPFAFADTTSTNCTNASLSDIPNLYQVTRTSKSPDVAQLYFTPLPSSDSVTGYTIIYGFQSGDDRYSLSVPYGKSTGAIKIAINNLDPKEKYTFKVRADNGCANGPFSNYHTDGYNPPGTTKGGLLVAGAWENTVAIASVFGLIALGGLVLLF